MLLEVLVLERAVCFLFLVLKVFCHRCRRCPFKAVVVPSALSTLGTVIGDRAVGTG